MEGRDRARACWQRAVEDGDPQSWFEAFYAEAGGEAANIPWADPEGHPLFLDWLEGRSGDGTRALVVGCGLGEDAEAARRAGFDVTAFDLSPTAIEWCGRLWPDSEVDYRTADLFAPPQEWSRAFELVVEVYTVQALPLDMRERCMAAIADLVAPGGSLLVVTRGREDGSPPPEELPWPLTREELLGFERHGLRERVFEPGPLHPDDELRFAPWRAEFVR